MMRVMGSLGVYLFQAAMLDQGWRVPDSDSGLYFFCGRDGIVDRSCKNLPVRTKPAAFAVQDWRDACFSSGHVPSP